tara:strand:+ start:1045 stop:1752 length:708 start_codon:yes stop_codon:yes gene_type:complete
MNTLCVICARGGSTSLKNKNIEKINGKPLIYYTIRQAQKSKIFDRIVVSTDSKKIQKISSQYGIEKFFLRPKNLSLSTTPKIPVIRHALILSEKYFNKRFDFIFDLDVTAPLRLVSDIKKSYKQFLSTKKDLLFSANESRSNPYFNAVVIDKKRRVKPLLRIGSKIKRRQDAPKCYDINASIYIWKRKTLLKYDTLYLKNNSIYIMPSFRGIDIDTKDDLKIVKNLMKNELYKKI